jgi:hypothetical protein
MKRCVLLILLLVLLTSCSTTKTIHLTEPQQQLQVISENKQTTEPVLPSLIEKNTTDQTISITVKESTKSATSQKQDTQRNEYSVLSNINGSIFIETSYGKQTYQSNDTINLLIKAYQDNCNTLKTQNLQRIYLKYKDEFGYNSQLMFAKDTNIKKMTIDNKAIESDFSECN